MPKALVTYYSRTGHTKQMAEAISDGLKERGIGVTLKPVKDVSLEELLEFDGIFIGSPTYYGVMAAEVKALLDRSVKYHGKLEGRVGGAFTSSANIGGGNETTIMSILSALLIHGMIIQGDPEGDHYGPVSIGKPDEKTLKECHRYGRRMANLIISISHERPQP